MNMKQIETTQEQELQELQETQETKPLTRKEKVFLSIKIFFKLVKGIL